MTGSAGTAMDVFFRAGGFCKKIGRRSRRREGSGFCRIGGLADDGKRWYSDGRCVGRAKALYKGGSLREGGQNIPTDRRAGGFLPYWKTRVQINS